MRSGGFPFALAPRCSLLWEGWDSLRIFIGWVHNNMFVFKARGRSWKEGGRASGSSRSPFASGRAKGWPERKRRVRMTKLVA